MKKFNLIIQKAKSTARLGGFFELSTPTLEHLNVFERNLGEESDVLKKEIYKFEDRGGEMLAMRPEFTASVIRSFVQNSFKVPAKIFSHGALFRYDRPQKGRYRQFHQINFENIGGGGMLEDVQTLILANHFLEDLGLKGKFTLEINSLGSKQTLARYKDLLIKYFNDNSQHLSAISLERLKNNPIRILDSKEKEDIEICKNAPNISTVYTAEEQERFDNIILLLKQNDINFCVNERIVRGLDYYTGIVFEATTDMLGSQATILAGGRYDDLIEQMGGKNTPAIGFAAGIERLALLMEEEFSKDKCLFLIPFKESHQAFCVELLNQCYKNDVCVCILASGNVGKRIEKASKTSFESFVLVVGDEETKSGNFKLKNLAKSEEIEGDFESLLSHLCSK